MLTQFKWPLVFLAFLLGLFFYYDYNEILFKRPQSVHYWRQADCASLALNYYQGADFFHPKAHNLTSDNFTTGYVSTSEMPLLYYSVSILYRLFGYHEYLYRLLNVLIFFTGLFYLYKLFYQLIAHQFWAMCIPLLLFTSPVLVYYANNFLSNSAALGVVFIGWYHFMRYYKSKDSKYFRRAIFFFTLAGLLKITALLSLGAVIGIYVLEKISSDRRDAIFSPNRWQFMTFVLAFLLIGGWTAYASSYNSAHATSYFSTTIFPIWEMSADQILAVKDNVLKIWFDQYFSNYLWGFIFLCSLAVILLQKGANKTFLYLTLLMLLASWAYLLLQYATLQEHDYYTINLFIIPVFILITLFDLIKKHFPRVIKSKIAIGLVLCFTLYNIHYAKGELTNRYYGSWNNDGIKNDLEDITPYLRSIGITTKDKVISIPDASHLSLYLMNQPGWTEYAERFFNKGEVVYLNQDNDGVQASIDNGAKYLVINGLAELFTRPYLHSYAVHLVGQFRDVLIFDLTKLNSRNFVLPNRVVKEIFKCNAERIAPNEKDYKSVQGSLIFGGASTQTNEFSYSGQYSSKLVSEDPFAMAIVMENVAYGESFIVSVMRKKGGNTGDLIAAVSEHPKFYYNDFKVSDTNNPDWELLKMEFHVPKKVDGKDLGIYLWNYGAEPVYFDDLTIVRFQSYFKK